jgi:hypothetical protein
MKTLIASTSIAAVDKSSSGLFVICSAVARLAATRRVGRGEQRQRLPSRWQEVRPPISAPLPLEAATLAAPAPLPEILGEALDEFSCLVQSLKTFRWPLG